MTLSDDERRELDRLEQALRAQDPGLDRRLARMLHGGLATLHGVLALTGGVALGVVLLTLGELLGIAACLVAGLTLIATVPVLAVVWWGRRYYCRYCAGKWPAPARSLSMSIQ